MEKDIYLCKTRAAYVQSYSIMTVARFNTGVLHSTRLRVFSILSSVLPRRRLGSEISLLPDILTLLIQDLDDL